MGCCEGLNPVRIDDFFYKIIPPKGVVPSTEGTTRDFSPLPSD